MFLKRLARCGRTDERGSALLAVLGVMAVGLILIALIATSVVGAFGFTSGTRAGVQSHAAADAGVVAARTGLYTVGDCVAQPTPGRYTSTAAPVYSATVQYNAGAGWQPGCPIATTTQVRIVSTGTAQAAGVAGVSSRNTSKVEAVFQYLVPGPPPSGVAMYLYGGGAFEANSSLDLSEGGSTGLIVKNGDFLCDKNNTVINGSILVNGNLTFTNKCSVNGNAWVSGAAALGSGKIDKNLVAASVTPNPPGTQVGGTYTPGGAMPSAPGWVDLDYTPTAWLDSSGAAYEVRTVSGAGCVLSSGTVSGTITGNPVIINALGCVGGPTATNNTTVKLKGDVVIFAKKFDFSGVNSLIFQSATTAGHRLWFITPDNVADGTPTCQSDQGNFTVKNGFAITAPIAALLYTPCAFDGKNGFTWNGQIYAGKYSFAMNNPSFTFVPVGAAGVNFDAGDDSVPIVTKPQPGQVVSMRDLNGVG